MKKTILIVDGHNLAYRCFHQPNLARLKNSKGLKTGVFYGFLSSLNKLCVRFRPYDIVVVFDSFKGSSQKSKDYAEYKSNRKKPKKSFIRQVKDIQSALFFLGIRLAFMERTEADDIIFHFAKHIDTLANAHRPYRGIIISADHDLLQCVSKYVRMFDDRQQKMWDIEAVKEHYSIPPGRISIWKALVGDASDNVKGVPGIGPKTAKKLLKKKTMKEIERVLTRDQRNEFHRAFKVVNIISQIKIIHLVNAIMSSKLEPIYKSAKKFLKRYECYSFLRKFNDWSQAFHYRDL